MIEEHAKLFLLSEGLSEAAFESGRHLIYLTERVKDGELRRMLNELRSRSARIEVENAAASESLTVGDVMRQEMTLVEGGNAIQTRLGEVLRTYL